MPRMTAAEAGRIGGQKGGKSRSPAKLAACRKNGFKKLYDTTAEEILQALAPPTKPRLLLALKESDAHAS
jgi:hypothetical protein